MAGSTTCFLFVWTAEAAISSAVRTAGATVPSTRVTGFLTRVERSPDVSGVSTGVLIFDEEAVGWDVEDVEAVGWEVDLVFLAARSAARS